MPTFGSLFAGIGGIDLGLERAGWTCRWQVEWDPFCQHVLAHHWPDVPRYGDITQVDWSGVERVDLLAGGFPCQPFSLAGRRRGKSDDRWLWPEFAAAIRALRPRFVLVENVPGLLAGHGGMGAVLGDLATLGYDAEWDSVPASAVGAPHLRYRVWIVGHLRELGTLERVPNAERDELRQQREWHEASERPDGWASIARDDGAPRPLADPEIESVGPRLRAGEQAELGWGRPRNGGSPLADPDGVGGSAGLAGPLARQTRDGGEPLDGRAQGRGADDRPRPDEWWATEPDVGRVAHGVPARVDRLRALGNAVVPQVVEVIGAQLLRAIEGAA